MSSHKKEYLLFKVGLNKKANKSNSNQEKYLTEKQEKDLYSIVYKIASTQKK